MTVSKEKQGWIVKNLRIFALEKGETWHMASHKGPMRRAPKRTKAQEQAARSRADYWQQDDVKEAARLRKQRERAALIAKGLTARGTKRKKPYAARPKARKSAPKARK